MSAPQQGMGARSTSSGPNAGAGMVSTPSASSAQGSNSNQNLNQIVIDYLSKKGYAQTEATLRREMNNIDAQGRVVYQRSEDYGGRKYFHAYTLLNQFIDDNLEIYKQELQRLIWPIFVYCFLDLVADNYPEMSQEFFAEHRKPFGREHDHDLNALQGVRHTEHLEENEIARLYMTNKYRLTVVESTYFSLMSYLEAKERTGGSVIITIIQKHMQIMSVQRASTADRSFAMMLARSGSGPSIPEEDEGIPGHNPGSANTDQNAPAVLTRLALGRMPPDADREADVRDELADFDKANPPRPGQNSLADEYEMQIKREESADAPSRESVPYPKALAREVTSDVEKVKAYRDRFKLAPRSGGIGPGVSVCMYTFHNTMDTVTCIDFSGDLEMVAAGFDDHYIRVWSLDGKPLPSTNPEDPPMSSRRLIGHSAPVYAVSFSPGMSRTDPDDTEADKDGAPSMRPQFLISASADGTIRLWELTTYACLVVYKGHISPVWDVRFSPHGHYFVSGGADKTARLWATNSIAPLRILAGHEQDVEVVAWHPNGAYIFTGSADRTLRMWDMSSGRAVRMFTSHTGPLTSITAAPNGRLLASADDSGALCIWNIETGRRIKLLRGHARGGIWSLAWSVESAVLVSAGQDGSVRAWDAGTSETSAAGTPAQAEAGASIKDGKAAASSAATGGDASKPGAAAGAATAAAKLARGAGLMSGGTASGVSPEQISCFVTKKSPVYRVHFTEMNLCLAAGAYMP